MALNNLILKIVGPIIGGLALLACVIALFLGGLYLEQAYKSYIFRHRPEWMATNDMAFTAKLREKFPAGTAEDKLIADLTAAGFKLYIDPPRADHALSAFPCRNSWSITWEKNQNGQLTAIKGETSVSCL